MPDIIPTSDTPALVITGASGFLGTALLPSLQKKDYRLLLVGRDPAALAAAFPSLEACTYEGLADRADGYDALLHLAILNNDQTSEPEAFHKVNVTLLEQVITAAQQAGIKRLIYPASLHMLAGHDTPYVNSKAQAEMLLAKTTTIDVTLLRLPAVYGAGPYKGRLALLNRLITWLRPAHGAAKASAPSYRRSLSIRGQLWCWTSKGRTLPSHDATGVLWDARSLSSIRLG